MSTVVAVEKHPKNADWRKVKVGETWYVVFRGQLADTLEIGKPLPPGTTEEPPKFDGAMPSLRLPGKQGSGGGYRNSKEAFDAEAASRLAWQQVEEERRDRRTALMQAVSDSAAPIEHLLEIADKFYDWLRESAPQVHAGQTTRAGGDGAEAGGAATGKGSPPAPTSSEGQRGVESPSAADGSKASSTGPGEPSTTSPGPTFPMSPEFCDHKAASGRWLPARQIDGQPHCPRCGLPSVQYRETA